MKEITKITFFDDKDRKFYGEGPSQLLHGVEQTGSLRGAAQSMGMAYTKALKIVNQAEAALGFPIITRTTGGRSGGGSSLTPEGKLWMERYIAYRNACLEENERLFRRFYSTKYDQGCVIMASGLGTRFGGNKLMENFNGKPLIQHAIDVTEGLFQRRVVVTRHREVETLCKIQNVDVVLHDLPFRSDTVRLGLEAIGERVDGCLFLPGDQPLLSRKSLEMICQRANEEKTMIVRAAFGERQGAPVYFPKWAFEELRHLPEGKGGGVLVKKYIERVRLIQTESEWELMDVDTREEYRKLLTHQEQMENSR